MATNQAVQDHDTDPMEVDVARDAVAARLKRFARRVRTSTKHTAVPRLDALYSEIVKLAGAFADVQS